MKYLLCVDCWRAWFGPLAVCDLCGRAPVDCSPWGFDVRQWYQLRVRHKVGAIFETLTTDQRAKRRSLVKGIRRRGNTSVRLVAS